MYKQLLLLFVRMLKAVTYLRSVSIFPHFTIKQSSLLFVYPNLFLREQRMKRMVILISMIMIEGINVTLQGCGVNNNYRGRGT